jgi:prolyl 4-hydroxylase
MSSPSNSAVAGIDELDVAGKHAAALQGLIDAAKRGDLDAHVQLGKRYLVGDRAPRRPEDAIRLFNVATEKGSADAPALLSILIALGIYYQQSWQSAFEALTLAATRGNNFAQDQLLLLSPDRELAAQRSTVPDYWLQVARTLNMSDLLAFPPAYRDLSSSPLVRVVPNFLGPEMCQWLIRRAQPRLTRARVYDAVHQQVTTHNTRTNSSASFELFDTDLVNIILQHRMAAAVGLPLRHLEAATVLHYAPGEQISDHYDFIDPNAPNYHEQVARGGQRVVTFLVYLNDDYQAGETEFPRLNLRYKASRGDALFFVNVQADGQPNTQTLHAGRPPQGEDKWIVSQFMRNGAVF